ncbi:MULTISPECIES: ABC transporter ATP-binding protein [unclassified Streptomyces]|uniref:ABC transporter ATP-binding protein n=1 Tax=unclassified Streptomyces TaxID=2593676 RepID=UPI0036E8AFB9
MLALLAGIGRITVPFTVQRVTDALTGGNSTDLAHLGILVVIATTVVGGASASGSLMTYLLTRAVETSLADVRGKMLRHMHTLTELDRRTFQRGALVARLTSDVDQISGFLQRGGAMIVLNACQLLLAVGLMVYYSWQLSCVVLLLIGPLAYVLPTLQRRLAARYARVQEHNSAVLALTSETIAGAAVIRAFSAQRLLRNRLGEGIHTQYNAQQHAQRAAAYAFVAGEAAVAVITAVLLVLGMLMGAAHCLTLGELTAFLFLMTLFVQPLQGTADNLNDLQNALAAVRRIGTLLALKSSVHEPTFQTQSLPAGSLGIGLVNASFYYPGSQRPALADLTLTISPGTTLAVVGETGSGKSTLLKLLMRAIPPTSGYVDLGGVALPQVKESELRSNLQVVPQDGYLFRGTIADNLRLAVPHLSNHHIEANFAQLGLAAWLQGLPDGIHTEVGESGISLSAGERQLVAVARAYAADPRILLLDEATSQLDPLTESRLAAAIGVAAAGRTTVAVAHRLSTAERADEILVMEQGKIVQRGPHTALLSSPGPYAGLHQAWRRRIGQI